MKNTWLWVGLLAMAAAVALGACVGPGSRSTDDRDAKLPELKPAKLASGVKLKVVATTAIVGDVVANVGGPAIRLTTLMGPDQDPHSFQPTPRDIVAVEEAQVVFVNGFRLEEGLEATIDATVSKGQPVVSVSAGIKPRQVTADQPAGDQGHTHAGGDPHVWFDPANVKVWTHNIETILSALDPASANVYRANSAAYLKQLDDLDVAVQAQVARLPADRRKLVTDHNALGYFADRYGFKIIGAVVPAISTTAEPSAGDLADLIGRIRTEQVPVVFIGTTTNLKLPDLVAKETGAQVLRLYTGELGAPGSGAETYIGMMRVDVDRITQGLAK